MYQGENGNSSHYARGKTLGGCSARNYMAYQRGTKQSYAKWAAKVGDDSYKWDNFLPYFQKSVVFSPPDNTKRGANATPAYDLPTLGTTGSPLRLTFSNYALAFSTWAQKALATIGVQPINGFTSGSIIGSSYVIAAINHTAGTRESSQTAFLESAIGRPNFVVYVDTMAKSVLWSGKQAIGVQVETEGYFYNLTVAKEVIVSAGAFQSPQFLMVSGVGPAATLEQFNISVVADRPGVGQNMWVSKTHVCISSASAYIAYTGTPAVANFAIFVPC
jgi:choline dehydrogenase